MSGRTPTAVFQPAPLDPLPLADAGWLVGSVVLLMPDRYQTVALTGVVPSDYRGGRLTVQLPMQGPSDQAATIAWRVVLQLAEASTPLHAGAFTTSAPGVGGMLGSFVLPASPELRPGARYTLLITRLGDDPHDTSTELVAVHAHRIRLIELSAEAA